MFKQQPKLQDSGIFFDVNTQEVTLNRACTTYLGPICNTITKYAAIVDITNTGDDIPKRVSSTSEAEISKYFIHFELLIIFQLNMLLTF